MNIVTGFSVVGSGDRFFETVTSRTGKSPLFSEKSLPNCGKMIFIFLASRLSENPCRWNLSGKPRLSRRSSFGKRFGKASPESPPGEFGGQFQSPMKYFVQGMTNLVTGGLSPLAQQVHSASLTGSVWGRKGSRMAASGKRAEIALFKAATVHRSSPVAGTTSSLLPA